MSTQNFKREHATEIKLANGESKKLTYLGSGSTCLVYRTDEGEIIKEFAPLINGRPVMSRKNGSNEMLTTIEGLSSFDRQIVEERRQAFDLEATIIEEISSRYRKEQDNMFLIPKDVETSLGHCHFCNYLGGETLQSIIRESRQTSKDFQQHFMNVLPFIISLYDEIALYHGDYFVEPNDSEIINLDIKPENVFAIKSQGDYIGVRNLDFGSARRIDDKMNGCDILELGLISLIRSYAKENANQNPELIIDQIGSKFFASSPSFYDKDRISTIIQRCLDETKSNSDISFDFKLLDILAAWKTFLFALSDSEDIFIPSDKTDEIDTVYKAFSDIFEKENNLLTINSSLWEGYYIYTELYEIQARSFRGKRAYKLRASEIAGRLRNILCILNGVPENKTTLEQRKTLALNRVFCQKDDLLFSNGLRTIKDIIEFCKLNGLKNPEKLGELYWFLMFGEKHK